MCPHCGSVVLIFEETRGEIQTPLGNEHILFSILACPKCEGGDIFDGTRYLIAELSPADRGEPSQSGQSFAG